MVDMRCLYQMVRLWKHFLWDYLVQVLSRIHHVTFKADPIEGFTFLRKVYDRTVGADFEFVYSQQFYLRIINKEE